MNELLPCPFCDGEAVKLMSIDGFTSIGCLNCNPFYGVMIQATTEAEAIAAWNARAERACYADEVTHRDCKYSVNRGWKERTCKQEERGWGTEGDHARVWLTCGHDCMVPTVQDLPNYCPNCGAMVVDE